MNIKIRGEKISDYNGIANANYDAFLAWRPENQYVIEPILVDLLRHNSMFDPELSLVADVDGEIAGHAMFSPYKFIVLGEEQMGVVLAPIAVKPWFQKKGIGGLLMEEGHRIAKKKGYAFSLLCGHEEYYPKFGYKTEMFSVTGSKVVVNAKNFNNKGFDERPISAHDMQWVPKKWEARHARESLALFPGESISEWSNYGANCRCSIILKNKRALGYVRYVPSNPLNIKELVAENDNIPDILSFLAGKNCNGMGEVFIAQQADKLNVPLKFSNSFSTSDNQTMYKAFMIKVLKEDSVISGYCEKVEKGVVKPGIISFPSVFDLNEE